MTNIYDQHDKAFASVSAYVIARNGEKIATIAFKFPRDGAGRLYAYVHFIGLPMVRGFAGGYGYDKRTAACANAYRAAETAYRESGANDEVNDDTKMRAAFWKAISVDGCHTWESALRAAGFDVWQAV